MTNQTELTAERIEKAIDSIEQHKDRMEMFIALAAEPEKVYKDTILYCDALVTAIAALRAEKERNNGCMYCVGFGISSATVKSDFGFSEKMKRINFCPYCGRRLTEGSAE